MQTQSQRAFQGGMLVPLLFATIIAATTAEYSAIVPKHYDFQEKPSCVRRLDVFLDRSVLHRYSKDFLASWPGNTNFDCKTYVQSKTSNTGIIAVIQNLKFRAKSEACKDFMTFSVDPRQRCGDISFGLKRSKSGRLPPPSEFISAFSGLFTRNPSIYMENQGSTSIDSRKRFLSFGSWASPDYVFTTDIHIHSQPSLEYEEDLQFAIAYTGFQNCEDTNITQPMFNCGYGVCILNIYVNDGVVNCPFGDCRDEGGCENAIKTSPLITGEVNSTDALTSTGGAGGAAAHPQPYPMISAGQALRRMYQSSAVGAGGGDSGGLRDIGEELKKHNVILGRIATLLEGRAEGGKGGEAGKQPATK
ncbi:uncharacterized protein LOC124162639 [Ischnura elegans]|uniref:uncharacterized protein LOC124162639 n=1 Tax=Ischnura elegans TaxID=197161 RepID=UPI001ED897F0|nr:uncharacterized protein LOC124162639 [Ischnura elegans]